MSEILRDRQIVYIDKADAKSREDSKFNISKYDAIRITYWDNNRADIFFDMHERIRDDVDDGLFLDSWRESAYDAIIATIDWSKLGQCNNCNDYYDHDGDLPEDFCSEDCEAVYESVTIRDYAEDER